jgi:hypothetical protein
LAAAELKFRTAYAQGDGGLLLIPAVIFLTSSAAVATVITLTELIGNPVRILALRRDVDWNIVRWYLPGAGAAAGGVGTAGRRARAARPLRQRRHHPLGGLGGA